MNKTTDISLHRNNQIRPNRRSPNFRRIEDLASLRKLEYLVNGFQYAGRIYDDTLFKASIRYLRATDKSRIFHSAVGKAKRLSIDISSYLADHRDGSASLDTTLQYLHRNDRLKSIIFDGVITTLISLCIMAPNPESDGQFRLGKKLDEVASVFGLNTAEKEVLLLLYLANSDGMVERLFEEIIDVTDSKRACSISSKSKKPIMILTGLSKHEVDAAVSEKSTLSRTGILDSDGELVSEVIDFLDGTGAKPLSSRYFSEYTGDAVPLDAHSIDSKHIEMVRMLIRHKAAGRGINILLYGEPGTGKTEFARSISKHLGLPVYELANLGEEKYDRPGDQNLFRFRAYLACQKITDPERSVIIVDEADALLNSISHLIPFGVQADKGQINKLLDDSRSFTIWITNRYDFIAPSTKRRFDYSVCFEKMTFSQRRAVWLHGLVKYGLTGYLSNAEIDSLASGYEVNAGGIDVALRNASRIYAKNRTKDGILVIVERLMKAHLTILDSEKSGCEAKKANAPDYTLDGLNIKGDIAGTIQIIDSFNRYWSAEKERMTIRNMNLLLYGPPGTGKTEFAKYIARRTNRRLITKRASDLLSMWVGESEKNIKRAFEEAERERAILFLDEADSLLWAREGATHSWEVSQVNELLTRIETLTGMLICATNLRQIVDSAAIRRFDIKLEFDYLRSDGNEMFYGVFLKNLVDTPLTPHETGRIRSFIGLAPGDFRVVHQKYSLVDRKELTHGMLIGALKQELKAKGGQYGKTMGFTQPESTHAVQQRHGAEIGSKGPNTLASNEPFCQSSSQKGLLPRKTSFSRRCL